MTAPTEPPGTAGDRTRIDLWSVAWLTIAILSALAVFAIVRNTRVTLTQIGVGVVIALALDPLVVVVKRRLDLKRSAAVAVVGFGFLAIGAMSIVFLGPPARDQAGTFTRDLPATVRQFEDLPVAGKYITRYKVEQRAREWVNNLPGRLNDRSLENAATRVLSNITGMLVVASTIIAVLLDGERLVSRFRRLFRHRPDRLARVDRIGRVLYATLGQYFGGSLTVAVLMGLVVLVIALLLGIPLAPLAALWAMFTDLIPQVGGFLGGSFLVILALAKGPVVAIIALVAFVVYMNVENHLIQPAIIGQSVHLSPPTTMLAAFIGAAVAGLPGALVATPVVGATKRLYLEFRYGEVAAIERRSLVSRLRSFGTRVRARRARTGGTTGAS